MDHEKRNLSTSLRGNGSNNINSNSNSNSSHDASDDETIIESSSLAATPPSLTGVERLRAREAQKRANESRRWTRRWTPGEANPAIAETVGFADGSVSTVSIVALLQPGQTEAWKAFAREMYGPRHEEYKASRRRLGITREKVLLLPATQGDLTIAYVEASQPETLFARLAASQDPFDIWFAEQTKTLYGKDLKDLPVGPATLRY